MGFTLSFLFFIQKPIFTSDGRRWKRKRCQSETKLSSNVRTRATRVFVYRVYFLWVFATMPKLSRVRKPHPSPRETRLAISGLPRHPQRAARLIFFDDRLNFPPPSSLFPHVCTVPSLPPPSSSWKKPWFVLRNNRSFCVLFFFSFFFFETVENVRRRKKRPAAHSTNTCRVLSFSLSSLSLSVPHWSNPLLLPRFSFLSWTRVGE